MKISRAVVMFLMATSSLYAQSATTNSVYLDQVGNSSTITINQKGQSNLIGTEGVRFQLQGDAQSILINQNGVGNNIQGSIVQGDNVTETQNYVGDNNSVVFDEGSGASVAGSTRTLTVTGDSNTLTFNQGTLASSTNAEQEISFEGDDNTYTSTINANDVHNDVEVKGDSNTLTMVQNGHAGKNTEIEIEGSHNTMTINQTSATHVDTLKISTEGNGSNILINQCHGGGVHNSCQ